MQLLGCALHQTQSRLLQPQRMVHCEFGTSMVCNSVQFCLLVMLKFTYFTHSLSHHRIHAPTHLHKWSSTKISAINSLCVCQLNDGATRVGDGIHRVVHLELSSLNA